MADIADKAQAYSEAELAAQISNARADIPPGRQGECDQCEEWSGRLIEGLCAPCRDLNERRRRNRIGRP
jgi:hypothetical protein